jgi:hypothetical protein
MNFLKKFVVKESAMLHHAIHIMLKTFYLATVFICVGQPIYFISNIAATYDNGFYFIVCVENTNFADVGKRFRNYPKHEDIIKDLSMKRNANPVEYALLYESLQNVYLCKEVSTEQMISLSYDNGLNPDLIVKTVKWLFIEQDIRYWNYSGRDMLWGGIPQPL